MCVIWLLLVALWCAACQVQQPPQLVEVGGPLVSQLRMGDTLEVSGRGFPEGRRARLTLSGALYRSGQVPETGVELSLPALSSAHDRMEIKLPKDRQQRVCGGPEGLVHTTFRGTISVAFAPNTKGAPPIVGSLPNQVLDFYPADVTPERQRAENQATQRALGFLGLDLGSKASGAGVSVQRVRQGSPAAEAGILAGDVITEFAELNVLTASDLIPPGGVGRVQATLLRPSAGVEVVVSVGVGGFSTVVPKPLSPAAWLLAAVGMLFVVFAAPVARGLGWYEYAWRRRDKLTRAVGSAEPMSITRITLAELTLLVAFCVALFWFSSTSVAVLGGFEVPLAFAVASASLLLCALIGQGFRPNGRRGWSLRLGLKGTAFAVLMLSPAVASLVCATLASGGFSLLDVVRSQGPYPWQWFAFRSPVGFLALGVLLLSAWPSFAPRELGRSWSRRLLIALEAWYTLTVCALSVAFFLGGFRLSEAPDAELWPIAGAVFCLKFLVLYAAIRSLRSSANYAGPAAAGRALLIGAPLAATGLLATALASQWWQAHPLLQWYAEQAGIALLITSGVVAVSLLARRTLWRRAAPSPNVNPWL